MKCFDVRGPRRGCFGAKLCVPVGVLEFARSPFSLEQPSRVLVLVELEKRGRAAAHFAHSGVPRQEPNVTKVGSDGRSSRIACSTNQTLLRLAAMDAPPVGMHVGTSILALRKLHKMLLVPQKPVFPDPGNDSRFARLPADGAPNKLACTHKHTPYTQRVQR